ncbi:competence protein ComGF [Cytobacillus purgationiresistens]|uniref:Competence protein ComGF n=2 Tax=Cytobacillus purgationiresistens TaxID=863449 RepID=A0ABU0ADV2_9BACI|nr:competence protein ComGF [Cytobacillus purgationiresistens]
MKIRIRKGGKYVKFMNDRGFTLLEMIFAFSVFFIIVSFLPLGLKFIFQNQVFDSRMQHFEWQVFTNQLKKEMRMSDGFEVAVNRLTLLKDGSSISYEPYGSNIRRQVNLQGHEIVLQQVDIIQYERLSTGVKMTVQDRFKQIHQVEMHLIVNQRGPFTDAQ